MGTLPLHQVESLGCGDVNLGLLIDHMIDMFCGEATPLLAPSQSKKERLRNATAASER
jgi:hypothetical protein